MLDLKDKEFTTKDFSARTEFLKRKNAVSKDKWLTAIDLGYSTVKIYTMNKIAIFPAFAKKGRFESIGEVPCSTIVYKDLLTGENWIVGQAAQELENTATGTVSDNVITSEYRYSAVMTKVLAETAIGISLMRNEYGDSTDKEMFIATGLPPKRLENPADIKAITENFSGHHKFLLKVGNGKERLFDITIKRENISVTSQPKGTLNSLVFNNEHKVVSEMGGILNKRSIIFDPGFGTLDIYGLSGRKSWVNETFTDLGMMEVFRRTCQKIRDKFGVSVSVFDLIKKLEEGSINVQEDYDGFNITIKDFTPLLYEAKKEVWKEAIQRVNSITHLADVDYFIYTGGTSSAWETEIYDTLKNMPKLNIVAGNKTGDIDLVYANVRGFFEAEYLKKLAG